MQGRKSPLETQLAVAKDSHWGQELRRFAKQEVTRAAMDDARRRGLPASEAPPPEAVPETEAALYRTAGRFLRAQLQRIAQKGQVDGSGRLAIDPRSLGDADRQLLDMHQRYLGSWQEVVLVIKDDADGAVGVVLNRPAATEGAPHLSRALVEALESDGGAKVTTDAFDGAFGKTIAAYVGKPAAREGGSANKAMVVHGLDDVEGARELAPNLGIYRGGAAAAAERVQAGTAEPLDFRFFIGRYEWGPGELAKDVRDGVYRPAACSRGVAPTSGTALASATPRRRTYSSSISGSMVSPRHSSVPPTADATSLGPRPTSAACHTPAWSSSVAPMKYGRSGPRTVLKPAQPKEKRLRISCNAQHDEDSRPSSDHISSRCANVCTANMARDCSAIE